MRGHLTEEEITRFTAHLIKGKGRVSILTHLEMCEMCRTRIEPPIADEILKRLRADEETDCDCARKLTNS